MKPDWKDAPQWANWVAMDSNGEWYWFDTEPILKEYVWGMTGTRYEAAPLLYENWNETAEQRP